MKYTMTKPCQKCPFRTDVKPYLRPERALEILDSLIRQQQSFPCHKTVDYEGRNEGRVTQDSQHCAGAMILLEKMECPNQMMRISERLGFYDRTKLDMDSPVYGSDEEMIEAYVEAGA